MTVHAALIASAVLAARLAAADLVGVVSDGATGEPVAGAVVALEDLGRSALTDEDGVYRLADVPPGPQHLSVRILGYQTHTLHVLVPASGALRVDLILRRDPIEVEAVVVRGRVAIRGVEVEGPDLDPARRLSAAAIRNDPFTPEPDVLEALAGGGVAGLPESGGGLHVRGGAQDQVGYLLDGIPVFGPYHSGVRSGAWSPDAVERVELLGDPTLPADALSGAVSALTLRPGERLRARGELSTGQAGLSLDGPLAAGAGFLASARTGFAGLLSAPDEPTYLQGDDHDVIGKLVFPLAGGELALLAFDSGNRIRTPSATGEVDPTGGPRNRFEWNARSFGARWDRAVADGPRWSVRAWRATHDASVLWHGETSGPQTVASEREQEGMEGSAGWDARWGTVVLGARALRDRAGYEAGVAEEGGLPAPTLALHGTSRSAGGFGKVTARPGGGIEIGVDLLAEAGTTGERLLPRLRASRALGPAGSAYAEYARTEQTFHSLRNVESVVGRVFPAELYAGGKGSALPEARSRTGVMGLVAIPWSGARLQAEAYTRSFDGLALVAPAEGGPFAAEGVRTGSGSARGAWVGLAASAARYAVLATYGAERVRLSADSLAYAPAHTARHRVRLGAVVFPSATWSVRAAWVADFGRRGTDAVGRLEWESCNLLDQGCEFAGSPDELGPLGGRSLPGYQRLDLSVRKHWHVAVAGRDARVEAFATATNLAGRSNVLVYVVSPDTGEATPLELRPLSPLTVGVAWSF